MIIELKRQGHIQRILYEEFEARVQDGEIPPDLPIRFDAVTGSEFIPAGELEFYRELVDPKRREFRARLMTRGIPLATAILVGVQIRIYLASWAPGLEELFQSDFTNWAPAVEGETTQNTNVSALQQMCRRRYRTCIVGVFGDR